MNFKQLTLMIAVSGIMLSSCDKIGEILGGKDTLPEGALPSVEFTLNDLPDESFAEDAIKVVIEDEDAPFHSVELMPDGYYLLTPKPTSTKTTRGTDGTMIFYNGNKYGPYKKMSQKEYYLSCGIYLNLEGLPDLGEIICYTETIKLTYNGKTVERYDLTPETASLCRAWNYNSLELWGYYNGIYFVHGKQYFENGKPKTEFHKTAGLGIGLDKDEFFDDESEMCYKVVFSSYGTYMTFYLDGSVEEDKWEWKDKDKGIISWYYFDDNRNVWEKGESDLTIRFAGNQMRVYQGADTTYDEVENKEDLEYYVEIYGVSTLTACE